VRYEAGRITVIERTGGQNRELTMAVGDLFPD
jgi:hypothetical protein